MTTYYLADGRPFVLAHHSPSEWADAMADRLRALGCSEQYVRKVTRRIRAATTDQPEGEA